MKIYLNDEEYCEFEEVSESSSSCMQVGVLRGGVGNALSS